MNKTLRLVLLFYSICLSLSFSEDRYKTAVNELYNGFQSSLNSLEIIITKAERKTSIIFNNIRLISPVMSYIEYEYAPDKPLIFNTHNLIFTFIANATTSIETLNKGISNNDFFFQLTCKDMNYYIENKLILKLQDYVCDDLYFSNQTTLGALKSFKFFNNNNNLTKGHLAEIFRKLIIEKTYKWFNTTNLIYYDALSIFDEMKLYYSGKEKVTNIDNYQVKYLEVKSIDYFNPNNKIDFIKNELQLTKFEILFQFYWKKTEDTEYTSSSFKALSYVTWTISHLSFSKDLNKMYFSEGFCEQLGNLSLCNGILALFFETFQQIFCEYLTIEHT